MIEMPGFLRKDDVRAQYKYVSELRSDLGEYPSLEPLIRKYEQWYQEVIRKNGLMWAWNGNEYFDESRRQVAEINKVLGQTLPKTWVPADIASAVPEERLANLKKALKYVGVGAVAAVGAVIWANNSRIGPPPSSRSRNSNYARFGKGAWF